jgi:hypothetical protein
MLYLLRAAPPSGSPSGRMRDADHNAVIFSSSESCGKMYGKVDLIAGFKPDRTYHFLLQFFLYLSSNIPKIRLSCSSPFSQTPPQRSRLISTISWGKFVEEVAIDEYCPAQERNEPATNYTTARPSSSPVQAAESDEQ